MQTQAWKFAAGPALGVGLLWSPSPALAQYGNQGACWWGWPSFMGWGPGGMGSGMMILIWGLLIVGGIFLVRWLMRGGQSASGSGGSNHALEVLAERYAKGEISAEQFAQMKRDILA